METSLSAQPPDSTSPRVRDPLILPTTLKAIAVAQVWGAATGTWLVLRFAITAPSGSRSLELWVLLGWVLLFYSACGLSALYLLRGRHWALRALAWAQVPQLIWVQGSSFAYLLLSGFYAILYGGSAGGGINVGLLSLFSLHLGHTRRPTVIGINVLAAITLWYLRAVYPSPTAESRRFPLRPTDQLGDASEANRTERPN